MMIQPTKNALKHRQGTTIIEVLFSIGIVVVGLAGIASLIPLAGRHARDSYIFTHGASLGQSAYREVLAREMHFPTTNHPWLEFQDQPQNGSPFFASLTDHSSPVFGICIDPLFWAGQPASPLPFGGVEGPYRRSRFPYYGENYNPMSNPASPATCPAQPRMVRVTLPDGTNSLSPMRTRAAERRFTLLDEFSVPIDSSRNNKSSVRGFYMTENSSFSPEDNLLQVSTQQDMTWMATLTPHEQSTLAVQDYYTLSIVVFHKRDRTFEAPAIGGGAADPDDLPKAERIAWAAPISSTLGGNGCIVQIACAGNVDSSLKAGNWVMLSRNLTSNGMTKHIHRWFRVVAASDVEEHANFTDPYSNTIANVWTRDVQLIGPDWVFSTSEPTTATIVDDVVSVYERVVSMSRPSE